MYALEILAHNTIFLLAYAFLLGLVVGSFLNVVVHRLPIMLEKSWRRECQEFLGMDLSEEVSDSSFNLVFPRSHCPHCQHPIGILENIPLVSYFWLRGKCLACKSSISVRYPLIELLTAVVTTLVIWRFGPSWQALWAVFLSWGLISLSAIDIDRRLLPDAITLPLLWLGLLLSLFGVFADSKESIIGAAAGYLSLWSVFQGFKLLTGKEGMGFGDFKLLSLFGAWLGWKSLLLIVLISSFSGAIVGGVLIGVFKQDRSNPIPFGPFLSLAGWIALLWGDQLFAFYWQLAGFR